MPLTQTRHHTFISRIRNLERMREISEVAVRHGFGYFFERHRLFGLIPRWWRRKAPPPPVQRGRHIREMLDELGPTFVKFGQLLSTRPDIIPPDIVLELIKLQDQVTPFSYEEAEKVITEDLGLTPARAFKSFDGEPLAAASIGQVYGAVLPGGKRVIVKVQRPEAARQIHKDLELLEQFAELAEGRLDLAFSPTALVQEFSRSINREIDYVLEARNAERFAINFHDSQSVCIPRIYWQYSSGRVLTMERVDGPTLNSPSIATLSLQERKALAEGIADCWFKQIFQDGFFHADPHPANIVLMEDGRIGLLDFGLSGMLRRNDLNEGVSLFMYIMKADIAGVKRTLRHLGVRWDPSQDEVVTQTVEEVFSRYLGRSLADVDVRSMLREAFDLIYALQLRLPTRFLLLDKAILIMEGVVSNLYPDLNVFDYARKYTDIIKRDRIDPRNVADRVTRTAAEYVDLFREYPMQIADLLEELRDGEMEIKFRHIGLEDITHRIDIVMNRLVVALVSIALGATGTAVAVMVEGGPELWGISVWGVPGIVGALFFGIWLIWGIFRSGRL